MCTLCDARKVREEDYSLFANPSGLAGVRFSSSFPRYVHHQSHFVLIYPFALLRASKIT